MRNSLAAAAVCVLLAGCASMSADAAFGGNPTPSAAMSSSGPASGRDGIYVGTADVAVNGGYSCRPMSITNFRVDGNVVRFGGFRGTIAADGSVALTPFRNMWFAGRFDGPNFVGNVDATGDATGILDSCVFAIAATRQTG